MSDGQTSSRTAPENSAQRPSAVIFGAGSVGRGFLGQLFSESGYEVVFVDVDAALVAALSARGAYTLRLSGLTVTEELTIRPVRAIDGRDRDAVAIEVSRAGLAATAVGARALPTVAQSIAAGLRLRWAQGGGLTALNIILCENLHDAPEQLRKHVAAALQTDAEVTMLDRVGFVPAVIARMSPVPTEDQRALDPTLIVAEPYKVLPVDRMAFVGPIPAVVGMKAVTYFEAYTARKLYIHNAAHALLGYLGYLRGHTYGYEAQSDVWVRERMEWALVETSAALVAEFAFEPVSFQEHIDYLLLRFANRALADPIVRLARDPIRKLAPGDRLVGAARLVEKHGLTVDGLTWGIAAALHYADPGDPHAAALQALIVSKGIKTVLKEVCNIEEDEPLGILVLDRYAELSHLVGGPV